MACPYFYPLSPLQTTFWAVPPRFPLGEAYNGECRAQALAVEPEEAALRQFCNAGYGREACARFPKDSEADAIRFHLASDTGAAIRVQYVIEKECRPLKHGAFEFSPETDELAGDNTDEIVRRQSIAFVESYRRRKLA